MAETTNKQHIYINLERLSALEQKIKGAGIGSVKPLAEQLAHLTRQTLARLSVEVFKNG